MKYHLNFDDLNVNKLADNFDGEGKKNIEIFFLSQANITSNNRKRQNDGSMKQFFTPTFETKNNDSFDSEL